MLISDLEYLNFVDGERSIKGGETTQAFAGSAAAVVVILRDASPGEMAYSKTSGYASALVDGDYGDANSYNLVEFGILAY